MRVHIVEWIDKVYGRLVGKSDSNTGLTCLGRVDGLLVLASEGEQGCQA